MLHDPFFFSSRRRHTRYWRDWSSDVCSSDLRGGDERLAHPHRPVAARVLDRVPRLVGRRPEGGERRRLADVAAEVQRAVARVVMVGEPALDGPDLEVGQSRRAQDRGGGLRAGHAVARRELRVLRERALDLHLRPQPEEQRDDSGDEEESQSGHFGPPPACRDDETEGFSARWAAGPGRLGAVLTGSGRRDTSLRPTVYRGTVSARSGSPPSPG